MRIEKMSKISKNDFDCEKLFQLHHKYIESLDNKEEIDISGTKYDLANDFIVDFINWLLGESGTEALDYIQGYTEVSDLMTDLDANGIHSEQDFEHETTTWYFDDGSFIEIQGDNVTTGQR